MAEIAPVLVLKRDVNKAESKMAISDPGRLRFLDTEDLGKYEEHKRAACQQCVAADDWRTARGHAAAVMMALYERRNKGEDVTADLQAASLVAQQIADHLQAVE